MLVELDPTMASADITSVQEQLKTQASEVMRTQALLKSLSTSKRQTTISYGLDAYFIYRSDEKLAQSVQAQLQCEWQDIRARLGKLDAEASRRQAEIVTVQQTIAKLEATVPMAQTREADFKSWSTRATSAATQPRTKQGSEWNWSVIWPASASVKPSAPLRWQVLSSNWPSTPRVVWSPVPSR